ncbi:hypothetical protein QQP08_003209 [Theobroma cacao]|nr:hypothetical protein QQP08_003209 [Theobroma cacao]
MKSIAYQLNFQFHMETKLLADERPQARNYVVVRIDFGKTEGYHHLHPAMKWMTQMKNMPVQRNKQATYHETLKAIDHKMNAKTPERNQRKVPIFKEGFCYVMGFSILGYGKQNKALK